MSQTHLQPQNIWNTGFGKIATRCLQVIIVGGLVAIILKMIMTVQLVLLPVLIALILASSLWPMVRKFRHKMSNIAAASLALVICMVILGGVGALITFSVKAQWSTLVSQATKGFHELQGMVFDWLKFVDEKTVQDGIKAVTDFATSEKFGMGALSGLGAVGTFFAGLLLTLVILFFFLKDGDAIFDFSLSWVPKHRVNKFRKSGIQTVLILGDYIRGTAFVSLIDTVGIAIGLLLLQVPLAIPLAVVIFLGGFIPMVGATLAGVLASLVTLVTNGLTEALIVAGIVILVNQLEGNFLQPKIMSRALSVHGLIVLVSLTAGTVLGGIIGAILAVPLVASAWGVIKIWTDRQSEDERRRIVQVSAMEKLSRVKQLERKDSPEPIAHYSLAENNDAGATSSQVVNGDSNPNQE